ncbi:MFS transporter [Nonomuraea longicatena]|uniref:Major facilitator superfamily (MFS) profile domain-containing protein n=1 Tax=Nonomuraea longicatena TaxID=83682 RepID=A0ABN1QUC7_9ACTN
MSETTDRRAGYGLLATLYTAQFLGTSFFATALASILRERGVGLEQLGLLQVISMISALRMLWAPLVDRFGSARRGHYRSWLLILQPALAVTLLSVVLLDPVDDLGLVLFAACAAGLLSATQDIAADALAVRLLRANRYGTANGIQVAGGYVGSLVGGGVSLLVYEAFGWAPALLVLATLTALPAFQLLRLAEPAGPASRSGLGQRYAALRDVLSERTMARWTLIVQPCLFAGIFAAYALVGPMLVDAGWSLSAIGLVTSLVGDTVAMLGALLAGPLIARYGTRACLLLFGLVLLAAVLALLPLAAGSAAPLVTGAALLIFKIAYAAVATVVGAVTMRLSRPGMAGADNSAMAGVSSLIAFGAGAAALAMAAAVGYPATMATAAALVGAGLLTVRLLPDERRTPLVRPQTLNARDPAALGDIRRHRVRPPSSITRTLSVRCPCTEKWPCGPGRRLRIGPEWSASTAVVRPVSMHRS